MMRLVRGDDHHGCHVMAFDPPIAMLDRAVLEGVARLAAAELTPVALSTERGHGRRVDTLRADDGVGADSGPVVNGENAERGTAPITEHALSRAIEAALYKVIGDSEVVLLKSGSLAPGVMRKLVERLPFLIEARRRNLTERHIEALVDAYLPTDALASIMPDIEADNAEAQADFLKTVPTLTAVQVAERAGHAAVNRSATAHRWKGEQKIFSIRAGGREVYPAFQFEDGRPRASLRPALRVLGSRSGWQIAFWFVTPNGWLGGSAPIDRLKDHEALSAAAAHEVEVAVG